MDGMQGKSMAYGQTEYTEMGRRRMKNQVFFGFPPSTESTGVISVRYLAIDSEDSLHASDYGYTPEGLDRSNYNNS